VCTRLVRWKLKIALAMAEACVSMTLARPITQPHTTPHLYIGTVLFPSLLRLSASHTNKQTNKQTNKYSLACRYLSMKVNEAKDILLKKRKTGTQA
jgi:hypothetical protein